MESKRQASQANSQDGDDEVLALIEQSLVAIRRDHARHRPGRRASTGDDERGEPSDAETRGHRGHSRSTDARSLGRAARVRMLGALENAGLTIGGIAESIGVDQPRASRLVQEATDLGLVRRTADPRDARRSIVELTAAGRRRLTEVRAARRSAVADAVADFTPEEARTFAALFARFVRSWSRES